MRDVANRTGAKLIDFVAVGAREVRGRLLVPRKYLVTNAYFEAHLVINAASCRSHQSIGLSGAMKNMFGCVIGRRKQLIHTLFPGQPRAFSRVIADIYRSVQPSVSLLDLTSVVEGAGVNVKVRPVGLILASKDAVALDTVAAHAIGYSNLPLWIAYYGNRFGLGCNVLNQISIRGIDWEAFGKHNLEYPSMPNFEVSMYDRATALVNGTLLRPRPVISPDSCTGCGDCVHRCPVNCIEPIAESRLYSIDLRKCVDCGCCLKVCEAGAINLKFVGMAKVVRQAINRLPETVTTGSNSVDPAG